MSQINDTYSGPVLWANVGYAARVLVAPSTTPVPAPDPVPQARGRRASARERAGGFLNYLTTVRGGDGAGVWQGAGAPSRRVMDIPAPLGEPT